MLPSCTHALQHRCARANRRTNTHWVDVDLLQQKLDTGAQKPPQQSHGAQLRRQRANTHKNVDSTRTHARTHARAHTHNTLGIGAEAAG